MAEGAARAETRIRSLDGLRGAAALVVVVHHCLLTLAPFAAPYMDAGWRPGGNGVVNALVLTPLHLLWDGPASVSIFFVLSGVVLTLPVLRSAHFDWWGYYPRRLLRLYLPIWAAVVLAAVTITLWRQDPLSMRSDWLHIAVTDVTLGRIGRDTTLLDGYGGMITPLWSLQWELWFSLLLPLFIALVWRLRHPAAVVVAAVLVLVATGGLIDHDSVRFLPVFALGVLLATRVDDLRRLAVRVDARRGGWTVLTVVGLLLISLPWVVRGFVDSKQLFSALGATVVLGALLLVVSAMHSPGLRRFLETRPVQYLGTISFSLYLVHEPIIVTTATIFGEGRQYLALPIAVVLSFAVAHVFWRVVERQSHRLARSVGRYVDSRRARPEAEALPPSIRA